MFQIFYNKYTTFIMRETIIILQIISFFTNKFYFTNKLLSSNFHSPECIQSRAGRYSEKNKHRNIVRNKDDADPQSAFNKCLQVNVE